MQERGGDAPQPPGGTLTPLIPLSLRAFKGEGERSIGACLCVKRISRPLRSTKGKGRVAGAGFG